MRSLHRRAIVMMYIRLHCDHTVHFSADLSLWLDIVQCSGYLDTKVCPPIHSRLFPVPSGTQVGYECATRRDISKRLKIEAKLLLNANRKSYIPR